VARKALWAIAVVGLATMVAFVLAFTARTIGVRVPYWGEAEVVFEASRLREGLPLFVDPLVGAREHGLPPSRWFVTYPPLWTWVVSRVPGDAALVVSRVLATLAWIGATLGVAISARPETRRTAIACAAFVLGSWVLANFATTGRPDAIACALAAAGLARAARLGRIDKVSLVLLVLVPWVKPTVLGLPAGAFAGDLLARRKGASRTTLAAIGITLAILALFHVGTGGLLLQHVTRANAQPFTLAAWMDHVPSRLPFFAPLFALAGVVAWRDRRAPGTVIAGSALALSILWTLVALAKTGSASNYWMEPGVAAVVVVSRAKATSFDVGRSGTLHAALAAGAVLYAGVASVRASAEHMETYVEDARVVTELASRCGGVVAADEAGVELAANGRILTTTYQMAWLAKAGRYPAETWIADLRSASCVLEHSRELRLVPAIDRALDTSFVVKEERGGFRRLVPTSP
jgi:hypothetical protein